VDGGKDISENLGFAEYTLLRSASEHPFSHSSTLIFIYGKRIVIPVRSRPNTCGVIRQTDARCRANSTVFYLCVIMPRSIDNAPTLLSMCLIRTLYCSCRAPDCPTLGPEHSQLPARTCGTVCQFKKKIHWTVIRNVFIPH
jgi:hypothetical protein